MNINIEEILHIEPGGQAVVEAFSPEETFALGKLLGAECRPGQLYTLIGDLGAGKTVFAQGFAKGLGIRGAVSSPTFTVLQIYGDGRMPLYHFDAYRIADVEEMEEIGYEDCFYGDGVCLVEWADLIEALLPEEYTQIRMERDSQEGFDYRRITLERRVRQNARFSGQGA